MARPLHLIHAKSGSMLRYHTQQTTSHQESRIAYKYTCNDSEIVLLGFAAGFRPKALTHHSGRAPNPAKTDLGSTGFLLKQFQSLPGAVRHPAKTDSAALRGLGSMLQ